MCDLVTPLNLIAGGALLLSALGILGAVGLWYAYHELRALGEQMASASQPDQPPALSSPTLAWSTPDNTPEPDDVPSMSSSVYVPPEPLWPDVFRRQTPDHEEDC